MDLAGATWRKSSRSGSQSDCVEVACTGTIGAVRDSKNPHGRVLAVDLPDLLRAVKADIFRS